MAEQELNRNEAATPHKLQDARRRGQVGKSTDLVSTAVLGAAMLYLSCYGWQDVLGLASLLQKTLRAAAQSERSPQALVQLCSALITDGLQLLAPFYICLMIVAILANIVQTGPVLSLHPIKPDWTRIHPLHGLRKLLSLRSLFDLFRALAKLVLLVWVLYAALKAMLPHFFQLGSLSAAGFLQTLLAQIASLGLKMALALSLIACIDVVYGRREFSRRMRMSRREISEERKQHEGHPRIRARLRALRMELRKRSRSLAQTKNADVLIINPTHIAIALCYRHGDMVAPQCVAKGAGMAATIMRAIATRHRIPVVQNRALARALFAKVDFNQSVPSELYADVARIIVWVFAMRRPAAMPHTAGGF